ncbi:MAG: 50S ribosomal protein L17 [Planctomycetota bacterium]
MRHRRRKGRLHVTPTHQRAMGRNLVASLLEHGRVTTTLAKAKAFRPFAERLITLARRGHRARAEGTEEGRAAYLHAVRRVARLLPEKKAVKRLFDVVAPAADRPGGYTRVLRLGRPRLGDNAPRALLELVDRPGGEEPPEEPSKGRRKRRRKAKEKVAAK